MTNLPLSLQSSLTMNTVYELSARFLFGKMTENPKTTNYYVTIRRAVAVVSKGLYDTKKTKIEIHLKSTRVLAKLLSSTLTVTEAIQTSQLTISPLELGTQFLEFFGIRCITL